MNFYKRKLNHLKFSSTNLFKYFVLLVSVFFVQFSIAQSTTVFSENLGTPSGTTTIVNYSNGTAPATFQNKGTLTYSNGAQTNPGDIRSSSASIGYTGSSGGGNVWLTNTSGNYGFSIESINASSFSGLTLDFAYRKESGSAFATLSVDYWDGSAWVTIANSSSALFNQAANAATGWYLSKTLNLPSGAQISGLKIRFVKSGSVAIRLDDIVLKSTVNNSPTLTVGTLNEFVTNAINTPSAEQVLTVSGVNLTNDISIVPPAGYEISTFSGGSFNSTNPILLSPVSGTVATTNIYVRYNPGTLSNQPQTSGTNIEVTSTGATGQNVSVLGSITNLTSGDIALIGFNTSTTDAISFVALNTIPANTVIKFTDNGYSNDSTQMTTEGYLIYTAPSTINPGTIVSWNNGMTIAGTGWNSNAPTNFGLNASGEQIFVFQGNWGVSGGVTSLLQGAMTGANWSTTGSVASVTANSYLPKYLSTGINAFNIAQANAYYTNNTANITGTSSELFTKINNSSNWTSSASQIATAPSWVFNILPEAPNSQPSISAVRSISSSHITLEFGGGSGESYMLVIRENNAVSANPVDGTNYNLVNGTVDFATATELGVGQKIVYNGLITGDSIRVTNLASGTRYHFAIFAYNGTSSNTNFNTLNPSLLDTITTGASNSINSDISVDVSFTEMENINYKNYVDTNNLTLSNSIELVRFQLRDGGNTSDADVVGTTLNSLGLSIGNHANLSRIALYNNGVEIAELPVNSSSISFLSLGLIAPDNDSTEISIRATFLPIITDNQQISVSVNLATANSLGSNFNSVNAGAAASSVIGDKNRIEVIANKLSIAQQPNQTFQFTVISPAVLIQAIDSLNNLDLDFSGNITVSSTGTLASVSKNVVTSISGIASFDSIIHSTIFNNVELTFSTALGLTSVTSDTFDILQNLPVNIFSENFGTPSSNTTLVNYNNGTAPATFQNKGVLVFSNGSQVNSCDFRVTNPSTSYTGSSSNGNAFFAATNGAYGLSIESINVSNYNNLTLQFGYRKENGTSHASLSVDYWNGTSWITLANTSSTLFNESASASSGWYLSKTLSLPSGAQISGLKIRFVKTGTLSIRIDDVVLKGVLSYDPSLVVSSASTFVSPAINSASSEQAITVSGNYLVDNISIVPSSGFEISQLSGVSFSPSNPIVLTPTNGVVTPTTIYVRYKPSSLLNTIGSLTLSSSGASTSNLGLVGEILNLPAGSISVIGFDATGNDRFSFVANTIIPEGTKIKFTDKNWDSSLVVPAFSASESIGTWTAPTGGLAKGSVVTMITDPVSSVSHGTGTLASGLSSAGEQIFAFQGLETNPSFISGFTTGTIINAGTPIASQTYKPTGLTLGTNFFVAGSGLYGSAFLTNANQTATDSMMVINLNDTINWTFSSTFATFPTWVFNFLESEPDTAPVFASATNISNNKMTLHFSGGNGSGYLVAMTINSPVSGIPSDAATYTANPIYGSGSIINTNEFVVYNGSTLVDSVEVTNLSPGTNYHFAIFTYNGTGSSTNYLTSSFGTANDNTTGIAYSNISDIVSHSTFIEPSLIDYYNYQETTNLTGANSLELAMFTVRDGSNTGDADVSPTTLNSISFDIENSSALKRLALYAGSVELAEISVTDSLAVFSGLNFVVNDDSFEDLSLRASFKSSQIDQSQMMFTVLNTTTGVNGSSFSSLNAGGAFTSTSADRNRIEVTATKLKFSEQPQSSITGTAFSTSPIVSAIDTLENVDLNFVYDITLNSTGNLSPISVSTKTPNNGIAIFDSLFHLDPDTDLVLYASTFGLDTISSNTFDITYNPLPGEVYISEISYESTQEWIELYNSTDYAVNIGNWYITDHSSYPASNEGDCVIPAGTILQPKSYVVVSTSGTGINATDLTDIVGEVLTVAGLRGANNRPTLNNSGDNIALYTSSSSGVLMDGSLTVNFPDVSNSNSLSIQRIANKSWGSDAFGKSTNVFASAIYTNSSPGFTGGVLLQGSNSISSTNTIPSGQLIELNGNSFTINGNPSGQLLLKGSATSDLIINGSDINLNFDQTTIGTSNRIRNFKSTGNVILTNNLVLSGTIDLDSGNVDVNGNSISISSTTLLAGTNSIDVSKTNSKLVFSNTSSLNIPTGFLNDSIYQLNITGNGGIVINEPILIISQLLLNGGRISRDNNAYLSILNSSDTAIVRNFGFVNAPLIRTIPQNLSTPVSYLFPIGNSIYNPVSLINPQTNSGGSVEVLAYVADSSSNGIAGTGMSSLNSSRYFYVDLYSGNSNFVSTTLNLTDTSSAAGNALASSTSLNGTYNKVSTSTPVSGVFGTSVLNSLGYFNTGEESSSSNATLSLTAFFEGLYLGSSTMTSAPFNADNTLPASIADTITVELHVANGTFDLAYSVTDTISVNGTASISFPGAAVGNYYYIVLKHRNSLETWSADSVLISSSLSYDFSSAATQAYGSNMVDLGSGVFGIYAGDINQDGFIDGNDFTDVDNDNSNFASGYLYTDTNGDGFVDGNDFTLIDNNGSMFIGIARP